LKKNLAGTMKFSSDVCKWPRKKNLRREDYWGGFIIDEMKIQVCAKKKICLAFA